jgi:ubiquinone/menaquinone biosynthesis C-methylase UbiE
MLQFTIEKLSNHPGLFLFCRSILEGNFKAIRKIIRERLPVETGRRILDVACGPGAFSVLFPPESYHGVDINKRYIAYAERHYRGSFRVMDARDLQFEDGSFDDALVFGLLHHLDDEDAKTVLRSLSRVLKPGGRALVIEDIPTESKLNLIGHLIHRVENGRFIRSADEYRRLLPSELRLQREHVFRSGICDYYMASLVLAGPTSDRRANTSRTDEAGGP